MIDLEGEIKVGVSNYISSLCHSVLRLEPYTTCYFDCAYCYARWYREKEAFRAKKGLLPKLEKLWSKMTHLERVPPFRLSTLIDPFQPAERNWKLSLRILRLARKFRIPIILNTKSTLFLEEPWKSMLEELASDGLLVLQVSVPFLREDFRRVLEPRAVSGKERLEAVAKVSDHVPCVIRMQPIIPGIFEESLDEHVEAVRDSGSRHVIVEYLRETPHGLEEIYHKLGRKLERGIWEAYSIKGEGLLRPTLSYRRGLLAELRGKLAKSGISLGLCKEGLYEFQDGRDCCGFRFLDQTRVGYRLTLYEVWRWGNGAFEKAASDPLILCGGKLAAYPNPVRKILRAHERKLMKVLSDKNVLQKVCPSLASV